jgi:biotin carboxyl carrier protein
MKRYRITLEGQTFDVEVLDDPRQEQVQVKVNGEVFTVGVEATAEVAAPSRLPKFSETSEVSSSAGSSVVAPLPGIIKSIAVRSGQRVAPNDELLVIEAMKMDNVIRAQRAGVIGVIHIAEGRQVAHGEPLLERNQ